MTLIYSNKNFKNCEKIKKCHLKLIQRLKYYLDIKKNSANFHNTKMTKSSEIRLQKRKKGGLHYTTQIMSVCCLTLEQ